MKRILAIVAALAFLAGPSYASVRNIGENYQLVYHVLDVSGNHVTGETVTLAIKKISNGYWFDFDDSTFKNTGWTSKTTNLTEDSTDGFYYYTFTPPGSETAVDEYQFLVDNASATYGDHQSETVQYLNIGTSDFVSASDQVTVATNNDKTGYTVSTVQDKTGYALTQAFPTNFSSLAITAGGAVTVGTNSDKTGYALTQTFPSNFSSLAITGAGAVTVGTNSDKTGYTVSTVQDKTGYSLSQTFPTNFADLAITASTGRVTIGTNADKSGYSISGVKTTLDALNDIAATDVWSSVTRTLTSGAYAGLTSSDVDAIWDEAQSGHTTAGTFGKYLDAQVSAAGSSLTAADVWAYATRTLTAGAYSGLTAADVDLVWDEAMTAHATASTAGKYLTDINSATNGSKEGADYTGIENMIRQHGR